MNNSKGNQNSPFKHKLDTDDFLAFSDISSSQEFSPTNYSSPQKSWSQPRKNYQNNWNRKSPGGYRQNNSPQNYYNKSYTSFSGVEHKHQKSYYKNSRNSTFNKSDSFNSGKSFDRSNVSNYLHSSFMENPWADLELQLEVGSNKEPDGDLESKVDSQTEES